MARTKGGGISQYRAAEAASAARAVALVAAVVAADAAAAAAAAAAVASAAVMAAAAAEAEAAAQTATRQREYSKAICDASCGGGGARGVKRSAQQPERASKRAATGDAREAALRTLGLGPVLGAMVREYLSPTYVYTVTSEQEKVCCGGGGGTQHGVYGSAQLARGEARQVLLELYRHQEEGPCCLESFLDLDKYDTWRVLKLRAACQARGLQCEEGAQAAHLRTRLRNSDFDARLEAVYAAAAHQSGGSEDQAEDALRHTMSSERHARYKGAMARFLSGALDAGDAFMEQHLFTEHWDGEDMGGCIEAPEGGAVCWGFVGATVTVTREEVRMQGRAEVEEEEGEEREEEREEEEEEEEEGEEEGGGCLACGRNTLGRWIQCDSVVCKRWCHLTLACAGTMAAPPEGSLWMCRDCRSMGEEVEEDEEDEEESYEL